RDRLLGTTAAAAVDEAPPADAAGQAARRPWRTRRAGIPRATATTRRTQGKRRKGASADAPRPRHHRGWNPGLKPLTRELRRPGRSGPVPELLALRRRGEWFYSSCRAWSGAPDL